ncbi:hypothetical protein BJ742DRAFT_783334 [Cladochytrium replicatum]|nr:hypothetical protein BJ742DRAFT_783334 [Cladochytrium replicatum]
MGSPLDADTEFLCWITVGVAAASTIALAAGLSWSVQLFARRKIIFRGWTRFQQLAFWSCVVGINVNVTAIAETILVMKFSPERLATHSGTEPFVSDQGTSMILLSLADLVGQTLLPVTVLLYFLILMERMAAFRFLWPGHYFKVLYTSIFFQGIILFVVMESPNLLINLSRTPLSDPVVLATNLSSISLIVLSVLIEWTLSVALCREFFLKAPSVNPVREPWSVYRRPVAQLNFSLNEFELQRTDDFAVSASKIASTSRSNDSNETLQPSSSPSVQTFGASELNAVSPVQTAGLRSILRDHDKRRTLFLLCGFVVTDVAGFLVYGLAFIPGAEKVIRPLTIIGRAAVGFHLVLALLFLDSFKQILRRDGPTSTELTIRSYLV